MTTLAYPIATEADVEAELHCSVCYRPIHLGQPYTDRVEGMQGEDAMTALVCVYC